MHDQADELRQRFRSMQSSKPLRQPKIVALSGGGAGVGTTTVAVNLSVALAEQGRRIVLIDADERMADATAMCEINDPQGSLKSVIDQRRSIHEVLERGPAGVLVLPGSPTADPTAAVDYHLLRRQCQTLGLYADAVLVDLGSRTDELAKYLWQVADMVAVVTTPEVQTVMDTYAAMKALASNDSSRLVHTIVNQAAESEAAQQVHGRLNETSRRFLGMTTRMAGYVPFDAELGRAKVPAAPILLHSPRSPAARAIDRLAETLWVILVSTSTWLDQRGAASEDFAPAAGFGPLAA